MASQITNHQCPACTGPLNFNPKTGKLGCEFCGSEFELAEIEALYSSSCFTMDVVHAPQADQWPNTSISKVYGINVIGK